MQGPCLLVLLSEWLSDERGPCCLSSSAPVTPSPCAGVRQDSLCIADHTAGDTETRTFATLILIQLSALAGAHILTDSAGRWIFFVFKGKKCPRVCRDDLQFSPAEADRMRLWAVPLPSMLPLFKMKRKPRKGRTTRTEMCLAVSAVELDPWPADPGLHFFQSQSEYL